MMAQSGVKSGAGGLLLSAWFALLLCLVAGQGAARDATDAAALDRRVLMSGHSLTDRLLEPLGWMVREAGGPVGVVARSTIPGSPLDWRWNNRTAPPDAREDIGDFDMLVITERVALSTTREWHDSDGWALRWAHHAWANGAGGAGADVLLYAGWVARHVDPQTSDDPDAALPWRERLDREYVWWLEILAHVNANRPEGASEMRMIPASMVLAAAHDAILAGQAPARLDDMEAFFRDDIHLSTLGAYLVAMTHFAVIYRRDPTELRAPPRVDGAVWSWMARLVQEVVLSHPETGVAPG